MPGLGNITGIYGRLGEAVSAVRQSGALARASGYAKQAKKYLTRGAGGTRDIKIVTPGGTPLVMAPGGAYPTHPRSLMATGYKRAKVGLRQLGVSGTQIGQARSAAGRAARPAGAVATLVGAHELGVARGKRKEKKFMMRGIQP